MSIPSNEDILALLAQLDDAIADALESEFLDFKPSLGPKEDLKVACEYAVCFANAAGGVVVFGVADKQRGRAQAIVGTHGHDVDVFKRGIYDGTRPGIEAEVLELSVPEGTGKLLIVRVPEGQQKPYGTAAGLFKQRVGKNCMPLDPVVFQRAQVSSAALDWSGEPAQDVTLRDLDPQVHTHALVFNATFAGEKWRSLASDEKVAARCHCMAASKAKILPSLERLRRSKKSSRCAAHRLPSYGCQYTLPRLLTARKMPCLRRPGQLLWAPKSSIQTMLALSFRACSQISR